MGLSGIDAVVFGVTDMAEAKRFLDDWGTRAVSVSPDRLVYETRDGGQVIVRPADAADLPGATAAEKARELLKATGVAAVAGSAFFSKGRGENLLRFCFAKKDADLDEACARLRKL